MRRAEREVNNSAEIENFIAGQKIIRIGFYDEGEVYIVPVNYGHYIENDRYCFYFHGAKQGRKHDLAEKEPKVGFEIDGCYELIEAEKACGHSARYMSVTGSGRLSLIENTEEKIKALDLVMKQATGRTGFEYNETVLERTAVFRLEAEKLSCKRRK